MSELIKGSLSQIIVDGDVPINNRIHQSVNNGKKSPDTDRDAAEQGADFVVDMEGLEPEPEPEEERPTIDLHELEELREHYRREGEEQAQSIKRKAEIELAKAKEDAERIRRVAEDERTGKLKALEQETAKALEKAKKDGFEIGYGEGMQKGTDDGYEQGLKKCRDTLLDLKKLCEDTEREKAALIAEKRRGIFDVSMAVAEKITMTVFEQKDKRALEKMITEAAKEFRSAKSVRVTLSKLDLSEDVEADFRLFEKCFSSTVNVEFEALEDAERGTLLMETDSDILDAGVSTQLRMIEELGRGKFRDKEPDEEPEVIEEAEKLKRIRKPEKARETEETEIPEQPKPVEKPKRAAKAKNIEEAETPKQEAAALPSDNAAEQPIAAQAADIGQNVTAEKPEKAVEAEQKVTAEKTEKAAARPKQEPAPKAAEPEPASQEKLSPDAIADLIAKTQQETEQEEAEPAPEEVTAVSAPEEAVAEPEPAPKAAEEPKSASQEKLSPDAIADLIAKTQQEAAPAEAEKPQPEPAPKAPEPTAGGKLSQDAIADLIANAQLPQQQEAAADTAVTPKPAPKAPEPTAEPSGGKLSQDAIADLIAKAQQQ